MDTLSFFLVQHGRLHSAEVAAGASYADRVFAGLTDEQMRVCPGKGLNSLVWLLWHMARTEDVAVNLVVSDGRQVFDDGWARRLGVSRRGIGTGMTENEVAELTARAEIAAVRAHRDAVGLRTREVVRTLAPAVWDEIVGSADIVRAATAGAFASGGGAGWQGASRGVRLGATAITHNAMHLGEAITVRSQGGFSLGI